MRHKAKNLTSCKALCLALLAVLYATTGWSVQCQTGDLGNGRYRNPILFADYSDPDVLGVGADYYMVASTFHYMPGIPVLHSTDLVNWDIVAHVFPRLDIDPKYDMKGGNRYGRGAWAPSIRLHAGRYFVYFPTPDEGIFMSSAPSPTGPWTKPIAVIAGSGLEDPCPFWDDDGSAYLVHSKLGAGPLILHRMSSDGTRVLDAGTVIMDNHQDLPGLEGPKFYKRNGFYYIFAPYGGVPSGAQAVLRAKNIFGPYEFRTVMAQGSTAINGPHQGGYVETPDGQGWFIHFQQRDPYGRITRLEPAHWADGWPVIGEAPASATTGSPVTEWAKPIASIRPAIRTPGTSDEFNHPGLAQQWEWNHNPVDAQWSLSEHPGFLRLHSIDAADLLHARNTLTELSQDRDFDFEVRLNVAGAQDGLHAGITMFSEKPSWIGIVQAGKVRRVVFGFQGKQFTGPVLSTDVVRLRINVRDGMAQYFYSVDEGKTFAPMGEPEPTFYSWWKGARPAIYSFASNASHTAAGYLDVDWVHYKGL
jgi:beta-xylosidase